MDLKATLRQLSRARGPTGQEEPIALQVRDLMTPLVHEISIDPFFNVVGFRPGASPPPRPRVMLFAHLDEIHLLVTAIEGPFLRFTQNYADARLMVGQEVQVLGKQTLHGVIGDRPPHMMRPHERKRMPAEQELVIDLGLDAETVAGLVSVGDVVLVDSPFLELMGERVAGKALDNRLGVLAVLATLDHVRGMQLPCDVVAVANVGEELSGPGAGVVARRLAPDVAIVLDVTFADQPGTPDHRAYELGQGPTLSLGPNFHHGLNERLIEVAGDLEIDYGIEPLPGDSGTDAWEVQVAALGAPTALISLPLRNMHSPLEIADLKDVKRTARWLAAFLSKADADWVQSLAYRLPDFEETTA